MNRQSSVGQGFGIGIGLIVAILFLTLCACVSLCGVCGAGGIWFASLNKNPVVVKRSTTRVSPPRSSRVTPTSVPVESAVQQTVESVAPTTTTVVKEAPARETREEALPIDAPPQGVSATGKVGQDVMVGVVRWKFLEAKDLGNKLGADQPNSLTTSGKFIKVRFEIENKSGETLNFTNINLADAKGRKFEASAQALVHIDKQDQCLLMQLNPNLPKTCAQIFEVPADASGLKAQVGDLKLMGGEEGLIDLGL